MWPHKGGMALSVLIGVTLEEFGMLLPRLVYVLQASSGMSTPVLYVPTAGPGTSTLSLVNVLSPPLGTVSSVSYVPVEKYTATLPTNVNALVAKLSTDSSASLTAPLVSSTTKPLKDAPAPADNSGTETSVSFASVDKSGTLL